MDWTYQRGVVTAGVGGTIALLASMVSWVALQPGPPGKLVIAAGGSDGAYRALAETYRPFLARNGVELELQEKTEGFATLRALVDDNKTIDAGFVKGGLVGSLQGRLARLKAKEWRERQIDKMRSVGRVFLEPIWVFTRDGLPAKGLRELRGQRILTGTRDSGTRRIAMQLLRANGVDSETTVLMNEELPDNASPLLNGSADAAILILPAESDKIQRLLRVQGIRLMDFKEEADAYANRFPALSKVRLRQGSVEFNPVIPSDDIDLLATSAALVVRADTHPALISLLAGAVINNPKSGFDKSGDPVLFHHAGDFPTATDPEFEVAQDARLVYKSGELPFVLRTVAPVNKRFGVPFSATAFVNAHGAQTVLLLVPMLTILIPLMRIIPVIYAWSVRRRLLYWYRQLKLLERHIDAAVTPGERSAKVAEIERIDTAVRRIRVPLNYSDKLYDLRGHIDLVRHRLSDAQPIAPRMAAE